MADKLVSRATMTSKNEKCKSFMHKRIPITSWLPRYNSETALADAIAGVTVGLTVMPQALAYAALAGLQPQYGLYSSFLGCFIYAMFGSCKDITIGPTALMALMTYQQVVNRNPDYAILLCFLTGCVMILMAFLRLGSVRPGVPPVQLPPFSTELGNRTVVFSEMLTDLGSSIILVPIIAVLGNVAIAKAFADGEPVDATQELFTLALCNLLGSFVSSMPITGSFSRSAVNHASGVKTTLGGIYTGVLLLLALDQLTPYFYYIPNASLAAVIISAVIFMIEYEVMEPMWKANRRDMIPMFATFVICLFVGVEIGIVVGVCLNIALLLIYSAKPKVTVEKIEIDSEIEYVCIKPNTSIYYPGVERLRNIVLKAARYQLPVVIDCTLMEDTDFTTAKSISSFIKEFSSKKQALFFYNAQPRLLSVLTPICINNFVHFDNFDDLKTVLNELNKESIPNEAAIELTNLSPISEDIPVNETSKDIKKTCEEPLLTSTNATYT